MRCNPNELLHVNIQGNVTHQLGQTSVDQHLWQCLTQGITHFAANLIHMIQDSVE